MSWYGASRRRDIFKHLFYTVFLGVLIVLIFFYIVLPVTTNHGETITVPDVVGISFNELSVHLTERNLAYVITEDSGFSATYPPLTVLKQFPQPYSKVKEKRKIYLTLNASTPPMVRMPNLVEASLKNAQMVLATYDLKLGKRTYVPDPFFNTVLKQSLDGAIITPGEMIPKGSTLDLEIGDGRGNINLESPNLIGLDEESAKFAIIGSGLEIGQLTYVLENEASIPSEIEGENNTILQVSPGDIVKQRPTKGRSMRINQKVDLWIYKPDTLHVNTSILDQ